MMRRHVAMFAQPGNGHVYPTLPLCAELTRRGHRVTYVNNEHYASVISAAGGEPIIYKPPPVPAESKQEMIESLTLSNDDPRMSKASRFWGTYRLADTTETLAQIQDFYCANPPDLVLYDRPQLAGRILAKRLCVPAVQTSAHFAYYMNLFARRQGVCENPPIAIELSNMLDEFMSRHGITQPGAIWHTETLNIHFIPRWFQYNTEWFDDRFCFTGPLLDRPFTPSWNNRSGGRPVILISGISMLDDTRLNYATYFGLFVDALADLPYHFILSIAEESFDRPLPANFELNRCASHLEILPHAALAVCHGGMTSTLEALYHGVPVLMFPQSERSDEVAYRTEELGLGVRLPNIKTSAEVARKAVMGMMENDSLRARVENSRKAFRSSGGAALAADRIENLLC